MAKVQKHTVFWTENSNPGKERKKTFTKLEDAERFRRQKATDPKVVNGSAYMISSTPRFPRR